MNKTRKTEQILSIVGIFLILAVPLTSAGLYDWVKKITGKATSQQVELNISVGAGNPPSITFLTVSSPVDLNEGPSSTPVEVNFTVNDPDGAGNINDSSAYVNFTKAGEDLRFNSSCIKTASAGNEANYTCTVTMFWFDGAGVWNISALISDINSNTGTNNTETLTVNTLTGFVAAPAALTFPTINPGTFNTTATNDPVVLNNTGNQDITDGNIQINATNLRGETDSNLALYSGNFSVGNSTGAADPECDTSGNTASRMNETSGNYATVKGTSLPAGNFTINDGTAQEELYFCLVYAGQELTQQAYSTSQEGAWTIKVV